MKHLSEYINEEKALQEIHENLAMARIVASSIAASSSSGSGSSSSKDDDEASDVGQNISGILRTCAIIGGGALASLTGVGAITAGIVLMIMAVSTIPLGKWIDSAIYMVKKIKSDKVSESLDDEEIEYIDEGLADKLKKIKDNIKEKTVKAFAKIAAKNKSIRAILDDMKNADGYEDAVKSQSFEELAKFVGGYFKDKKDVAEKAGNELKEDDTTIAEA